MAPLLALCGVNPSVTDEFPSQRTGNAEIQGTTSLLVMLVIDHTLMDPSHSATNYHMYYYCLHNVLGPVLPIPYSPSTTLATAMKTSSNGNIFRVAGHLCGKSLDTGEFPTQRPVTRSFDVFFDLRPNKRLSKQWQGWWFETPLCSLWRHYNANNIHMITPFHHPVLIHYMPTTAPYFASDHFNHSYTPNTVTCTHHQVYVFTYIPDLT